VHNRTGHSNLKCGEKAALLNFFLGPHYNTRKLLQNELPQTHQLTPHHCRAIAVFVASNSSNGQTKWGPRKLCESPLRIWIVNQKRVKPHRSRMYWKKLHQQHY